MACILCHVFQALGHIFNSLSSKLQQKTQESMKIESKDTDTEQPSAARSFVFPSKKKRVSAEKDPFFLVGARCARAFFFLRKFTFQKHQTVSQKIDCRFLSGVDFSKICPFWAFLDFTSFAGNGRGLLLEHGSGIARGGGRAFRWFRFWAAAARGRCKYRI